jgi:hypothetical protein
MPDPVPRFHQLNLVVRDMDAVLAFYRTLGLPIRGGDASREAVDELYAKVTAAGYTGRQRPYDAFWGGRYAVVGDPEGNDVGLMSPIDPDRRYTPQA